MEKEAPQAAINDLDYKARRALVLGVTGTGKSTLMARFIHAHPAELVLIYDWQGGEFAKRLGGKIVEDRDELKEAIEEGYRVVCYNAEEGEPDPTGQGFDWFCEMAFEVCGQIPGRKLIVVDECHDLIDPWNIPPGLESLLRRGRRRRIDTLIAGEAPNALQMTARNQVSELYVFRLTDDNARKYPRSLGMDDEKIKNLPDTHFIFRDMRTGQEKELDLWGKKTNPG